MRRVARIILAGIIGLVTTLAAGCGSKVGIENTKEGSGPEAKWGDVVSVEYTGWLANGTKFDSSHEHGQPFRFRIGESGAVIRGWQQGIVGMKVGGIRKLVIPPSLAYGSKGNPPVIPPNAELTFEVELVGID